MKYRITISACLAIYSLGYGDGEKYVIGTRGCGFFSSFFQVLHGIEWCIRANRIPVIYWDQKSPYYNFNIPCDENNNAWEYYFDAVSNEKYISGDVIDRSYTSYDGRASVFNCQEDPPYSWNNKEHRRHVKEVLLDKFIMIKPNVRNKIEAFYQENMAGKKMIGIHLRGTDNEARKVVPLLLKMAQEYLNEDCQFYIATDQQIYFEMAHEILQGRVIAYSSFKSESSESIHHRLKLNISKKNKTIVDKTVAGEEVLIESQLLARCDILIHPFSNVSIAALFFNPELPSIYISNQRIIYKSLD